MEAWTIQQACSLGHCKQPCYPACCGWWGRWEWAVLSSSSMRRDKLALFVASPQSSGCPVPGRNDADPGTEQWAQKRTKEKKHKQKKEGKRKSVFIWSSYFVEFLTTAFHLFLWLQKSQHLKLVLPVEWKYKSSSWSRRIWMFPELRCVCMASRLDSVSCSFLD